MDRFARFFCDPKKVVKLVLGALFAIFLLIYVYLQAMGGFDGDIETEKAYLVSMNDVIEARGYIFRDETVIGKAGEGAVVTLVSEGDRVSKGQLIANVYSDIGDITLQDDINRISRRLSILEESKVDSGFVMSDLTRLDDDIDEILADIYENSSRGNLSSVINDSSELLVKLNKRDLIVESDFDYSAELASLTSQKEALQAQIGRTSSPLYAPDSGYFYGEADGYENDFDISLVENITLDKINELSQTKADESVLSSSGGKIVNDFIWYTVCVIDYEDIALLKEGRDYSIAFPENADEQISMLLERIVKETNSESALCVFRANVLPKNFDYKRTQQANIVLGGIEGLSVPKKALRTVDGVEGVYVLVGDVVRFRRVERIAEKDDYYVVKYITDSSAFEVTTQDNQNYTVKNISLYDNVIISGKNLFDGKIAV